MKKKWILLLFIIFLPFISEGSLFLRDNFKKAKSGDFIIISQGKTCSLLLIQDAMSNKIALEEISFPMRVGKQLNGSWKEWVSMNAPGHTLWIRYLIDLNTGSLSNCYSFTHQNWYEIPDADNYLGTLLNLRLEKIPEQKRRRVGLKSAENQSRIWQPHMIVEGSIIPGISFDAWRTIWPRDGSELSGKAIEIYLPQEFEMYPSYFPYWLEVGSGLIGKAKIRIIDSGKNLVSPKTPNP